MAVLNSHNKKNKRYIAKTISIIYKKENNIPTYLQDMLVKRLLWANTEHDDNGKYKKYEGQPFWTIGAIQQYLTNLSAKTKNKKANLYYNLRHEHSVPKVEIMKLISASDKSEATVYEILDKLGYAVIVSKEEDDFLNEHGYRSKMPITLKNNSKIDNIFSRYKKVGIKVCDVRNTNLRELIFTNISDFEKKSLI